MAVIIYYYKIVFHVQYYWHKYVRINFKFENNETLIIAKFFNKEIWLYYKKYLGSWRKTKYWLKYAQQKLFSYPKQIFLLLTFFLLLIKCF